MPPLRSLLSNTFILLTLVPILLLGGGLSWMAYRSQVETAYEYEQSKANYIAFDLHRVFSALQGELYSLNHYRDFLGLPSRERREMVMEVVAREPMVRAVVLLDGEGRAVAQASTKEVLNGSERLDWAGNPVFQRVMATHEPQFGAVYLDGETGEPLVMMLLPLENRRSGAIDLVLSAELQLKSVWDIIAENSLLEGEVVYLLDNHHRILAHPDPSISLSDTIVEIQKDSLLNQNFRGDWVVSAIAVLPMGDLEFHIVAEREASIALRPAIQAIGLVLLITTLAGGGAIFATLFLVGRINRPVQLLTDAAKAVKWGDEYEGVAVQGFQEIEALSEAFDAMTDKLQAMLHDLEMEVETRQAVEEALLMSQVRLETALGSVSDGYWELNYDLNEMYFSGRYFAMLGYDAGNLEGSFEAWKELLHPEDRDEVVRRMENESAGGLTQEFRLRAKSGEWRWFSGTSRLLDDGDRRLVVTCTDITERKRSEQALMESEERFRAMFQRNAGIMMLIDPVNGDILEANDAAARFYGWTTEALKTMNIDEINTMSPDYVRLEMQRVKSGEKNYCSFVHSTADGSLRDVDVYTGPIALDDRIVLHSTVVDVTERKRIQEELLRFENKWRNVLELMPQIAISLDSHGRIRFANAYFLSLSGWEEKEVIGADWFELCVPGPRREKMRRLFAHYMKPENVVSSSSFEDDIIIRSGEVRRIGWFNVVAVHPNGTVQDVTCLGVDLTQREAAKRAIEDASRSKSEFLANMSHEIRTPLNGVLGMLQLMNTTQLSSEQSEYVNMAIQSSQRLTSLLSDILDISRVEAGKLEVVTEPFDLHESIRQVGEMYSLTANQAGIELVVNIDPKVPRIVGGDAVRLQQVVTNLFGNAFKFTDEGKIQLDAYPMPSFSDDQHRVLFSVSDTGIGIPDDKMRKLFNPFTQVSQGYSRVHQGAGLGLSICKRLVNLMGGNIAMESEVGKGTTLHFCIMFDKVEQPDVHVSAKPESQVSLDGLNVLLAEDDRVSNIMATRLLEKLGCAVTSVADGREVLDILTQQSFDVILMDIQMPVMDGVETTKAIRSGHCGDACKGAYIIALTAYAMEKDRQTFKTAGIDGHLPKPMDVGQLQDVLDTAIRSRP